MAMRAQISLQFSDPDLYNNFVIPSKDSKVLNGLIVKCLSSYYYSEEARQAIEGVSLEDLTDTSDVKSTQNLCEDIRRSLLTQDFLLEQLNQTVARGTEEFTISDINAVAAATHEVKATKSDYHSTVLKIGGPTQQTDSTSGKQDETLEFTTNNPAIALLIQAVQLIAKSTGVTEAESLLGSIQAPKVEAKAQTVDETTSSSPAPEVLMSEPDVGTTISHHVEESMVTPEPAIEIPKVIEPEPYVAPEPEVISIPEPSGEDGRSAAKALLSSLNF